ncbi:YncE family protein [Engelhardtia mirabilis]|uniref:YNCE-like beta-propeller domain-containing protein n=1 Tax=Engelhardtia mirabilis TaxID=2528011 RepID=A0A518BML5_9BACT|nr:hypothetical protein Pla133_32810 [Planctomycetes bacterium Pla133]QDV02513.1 hypothetical protein Pla86_32800 [Planctomycetes bacterium Pla86]
MLVIKQVLLALTLGAAPSCAAQEAAPVSEVPLSVVAEIALPGVEGRIDHLAVDLERERLYVAALGNDSVEVIDLARGQWLRRIDGLDEPRGILYLTATDRIVVASGGAGTCVAINAETFETAASVPVGPDSDNLRFDDRRRRVLVANGSALGALDAGTLEVLASTPLGGGHPEGFQLTPDGTRALVNVPHARQVVVVDLERSAVIARWKLEQAGSNFPLAIAPARAGSGGTDLCLVGCRSPARLLVRGLPDGAALQDLELSGDVDDLFLDARRERVYAACGVGFVDCFQRDGDRLTPGLRTPTAPGARTCLWVPERDRLYVAAPRRGAQPARILVLAPTG